MQAREQHYILEKKLTEIRSLQAQIAQLPKQLSNHAIENKQFLTPPTDVLPVLIAISNICKKNHLQIRLITALVKTMRQGWEVLPIHLKLFNQYESLLQFIKDLNALPYLIIIKNLRIEKSQRLSANILLEAYFLPSSHE
jgi:Tfp pilus assembly protein PilO